MDGSLATQHEQTEDERVHAGEETGLEYGGLRHSDLTGYGVDTCGVWTRGGSLWPYGLRQQ